MIREIKKKCGKGKVIIADDERQWIDIIMNSRLKDNYQFIYASDFEELYKKNLAEKPNIILTDSLYTDRNRQLIPELVKSALKNNTFILLYTAGDTSQDKLNILGATDVIRKPGCPEQLDIEKIAEVLEKYLLKSEHERLIQELQELKEKSKYDISPLVIESLKDWMRGYPDTDQKIISDGYKAYSVKDLIEEIEKRSAVGKRLLMAWIQLLLRMASKKTKNK